MAVFDEVMMQNPDLPTFPLVPEPYPPEILNKITFLNESQIK